MTKKELESLLSSATFQRDRAQRLLKEHFDDLEKKNQVAYWTRVFLSNKAMVEWVKKQKPDDG